MLEVYNGTEALWYWFRVFPPLVEMFFSTYGGIQQSAQIALMLFKFPTT
jgi:hypothetical protein